MRIVITGGGGFIGERLARRLLEIGGADEVILFDRQFGDSARTSGATLVGGDIGDQDEVRAVIGDRVVSVFHLASMVSGECEVDFDAPLRVNLDRFRHVLGA